MSKELSDSTDNLKKYKTTGIDTNKTKPEILCKIDVIAVIGKSSTNKFKNICLGFTINTNSYLKKNNSD